LELRNAIGTGLLTPIDVRLEPIPEVDDRRFRPNFDKGLEHRLAGQDMVEWPNRQVARPQELAGIKPCVRSRYHPVIVGKAIAHGPREAEAATMKWEESNRLTALVDNCHFNVTVSAGDGRSELRMKVGTDQVRIALAELLPPFAVLGRQLGSCKHFDIHLPDA
jgi:hypothetical protein